jgi:hypothetical protein
MTKPVTRKYIWLRKAFKQLKADYGNSCKISFLVVFKFKDIDNLSCSGKLEFAHLHPTKLNGMGR